MPELPEVATMVRAFQKRLAGLRVRHALVDRNGFLEGEGPADLERLLAGTRIAGVARRGKYVRIDFEPDSGGSNGSFRRRPPAPGASVLGRRPGTLEELLEVQTRPDKAGRSTPSTGPRGQELLDARRPRSRPGPHGALSSLIVHLKMTGRYFMMNDNGHPVPERTRLVLALEGDDHDLLFGIKDPRRLSSGWLLHSDGAHRWPDWLKLGPDALDAELDGEALERRLTGRLPIKVALLDQSRLAGLGNIYAAEVLHRAKIDPTRPADGLSRREWARLAVEIPRLLNYSMRNWCQLSGWIGPAVEGYGDFGDGLAVYGRAGEHCRRCGDTIRAVRQATRTTCYCPGCQK